MLMTPGPTNVSPEVREALLTGDLYHRDSEVTALLERFGDRLTGLLNGAGTHQCVSFVASGTGANEAVISAIHGKVLVIDNGRYSARMAEVVAHYGIPLTRLSLPPLEPVDLDRVEAALRGDRAVTHVLMVHHETATGVVLPLHEIGALAARYGARLVVDGISSIGACAFDLAADHVAFASLTPNKCLESYPGVSFVLARTSELQALRGRSRSFYFDLHEQWASLRRGSTPYTTAVQLLFAADCALARWVREGYEARRARYAALSARLRAGMEELEFVAVPISDEIRSSIVSVYHLPADVSYNRLHDGLLTRGIRIYTDPATVAEGRLILAALGSIGPGDVDRFLGGVREVLAEARHG
nr:aminotransferase class V-fold PLP-dependent enzyme [Longimicrobium terrae]